jgi:amidase
MAAWDAVQTAAAIAGGLVRADEVVEAALARVAALDGRLRSFTSVDPDAARRRAGRTTGPFAGVPSAVKDLYDLAGHPTTFGSRAAGARVARRTVPAVQEVLDTGVVVLGKSAAPEYGMTPTTEPLGVEATRNPWDLGRTAGGSSGGAAAMVAARIVPIAHATDGGGSTRIPAACCGLVGLKVSDGRLTDLPGNRQMPVRLLSSGVLTRTVRDTAAFLAAAERRRPARRLPPVGLVEVPGTGRLRVAVVTATPVTTLHPDVVAATRAAATALADLGHLVEEVALPLDALRLADDFLLYWGSLAQALPAIGLLEVGPSFRPARLDPWTRGLAHHTRARMAELPGAIRRLRALRGTYAAFTARHHLVLTPRTGMPAPPLGWLDVTLPFEAHRDRAVALTPFAALWNVVGAPAISLPTARSADGLPLGVMLGAAAGEERRLLEVALALEAGPGFLRPLG